MNEHTTPKIEIKYVEIKQTDMKGYLQIVVNGFLQPSIRMDFETGNNADIHLGLSNLLSHVYSKAYKHGERDAKQTVCNFLNWATKKAEGGE